MLAVSTSTAVRDSSQVGHARRHAVEFARNLGFSEVELSTLAIIVTEAANNLVKHAREGELVFRALSQRQDTGIEILAIDKGPGMADVTRCLQDGYSTAESPGTGLGAIMRMASLFDIYSQPGIGTVMVVQVWTEGYKAALQELTLEVGAVSVPIAHERVSGDGWALASDLRNPRLMMVDGLGHGEYAARAATEAERIFEQYGYESSVDFLNRAHRALASTRGAAMAIVEFAFDLRQIHFTGIGNISGCLWDNVMERHFVSSHGIVGHEMRTARKFDYPWPKEATIVLATDGLLTRWSLENYPGLRLRHPSLLAGVLYRDFQRGHDDVTVVAVRERM